VPIGIPLAGPRSYVAALRLAATSISPPLTGATVPRAGGRVVRSEAPDEPWRGAPLQRSPQIDGSGARLGIGPYYTYREQVYTYR